jgi:hypothetical protein
MLEPQSSREDEKMNTAAAFGDRIFLVEEAVASIHMTMRSQRWHSNNLKVERDVSKCDKSHGNGRKKYVYHKIYPNINYDLLSQCCLS